MGKLPWYFYYFLHSCKYNPTIDFLIFSDAQDTFILPGNVKIIFKTIDEIKALASEKIAFNVCIEFSYKLCDFKPAYGLIFEDFTKGYDFWGQSDIDVIYGDLRRFLTDEILHNIDFISFRHDYSTGCFTISRNSALMNNYFKKSKDYEKVFTDNDYLGFDELNFKHCELSSGKTLEEIETDIECFTHIINRGLHNNEIRAHFDFLLIEGVPGNVRFEEGKLIYKSRYESALYHLFWLKKIYFPVRNKKVIPATFYISPRKIYFRKSVVSDNRK